MVGSYKDQKWSEREKTLGDEAEGHFIEWCDSIPLGYVRSGLERPPLQMWRLPHRIRYTPDFLLTKCYVEVQGFGRDQQFKLKVDKHGCLRWWNDLHPVVLFVWDSHYQRQCFITLEAFEGLLGTEHATLGSFSEGKTYFSVKGDAIFASGTDAP